MYDIAQLNSRYNSVMNSINQIKWANQNAVEKIVPFLRSLTSEEIAILEQEVPGFSVITTYTAEDILNDRHGELSQIKRVYSELTHTLDTALKHLEEAL